MLRRSLLALAVLASACAFRSPERPERQDEGQAAPPARGEGAEPRSRQEDDAGRRSHALDARYAPLVAIVERDLPGVSDTAATTMGTKVYVADLDRWLRAHPPGSPMFEATMLHEQVHARRQAAAGVDAWIARYLRDRAFMWDEEQRGWYVELRYLVGHAQRVDAQAVARNLSKYSNLSGAMVSYDDALAWTRAVLASAWSPPR
jgi:hypothetical protein